MHTKQILIKAVTLFTGNMYTHTHGHLNRNATISISFIHSFILCIHRFCINQRNIECKQTQPSTASKRLIYCEFPNIFTWNVKREKNKSKQDTLLSVYHVCIKRCSIQCMRTLYTVDKCEHVAKCMCVRSLVVWLNCSLVRFQNACRLCTGNKFSFAHFNRVVVHLRVLTGVCFD